MLENQYLKVTCDKNTLTLHEKQNSMEIKLTWAKIGLQTSEGLIHPEISDIKKKENSYEICGENSGISFQGNIILEKENNWCEISITYSNENGISKTPDCVILADTSDLIFTPTGYKYKNAYPQETEEKLSSQAGEEASGGRVPGCGYPVFSEKFFAGINHPAAFTLANKTGFTCKHFPVWTSENTIKTPALVIGCAMPFKNVRDSFMAYINKISGPRPTRPILCCCTFWSDPYIGNFEYRVNNSHYMRYIKQFLDTGIKPDMLMLDAGWNDRNSFFQAKEEIGRDKGLKELSDFLAKNGIEFGLWASINGSMGVNHEWAEKQGYPIGQGRGSAYSYPNIFTVLMDNDFGRKIGERFAKLAKNVDCDFFKIDWDNDCATNDSFKEKYLTENHVRVANIDEANNVHSLIRKERPSCNIRNGWWPSPWWLPHISHTFLAESGDCEYTHLPSLTQRERETTHRDTMYYFMFGRDKTPFPLDAMDNHEIAKAFRNPFTEHLESWCNAIFLLFMRGTTYLSVMLNAASMTDEEADVIKDIRRFSEKYQHILYNSSARFVGGNPSEGEIYGFVHQTENEAIAIVRNPSVSPKKFVPEIMKNEISFTPKQSFAVYPYCESICDNTEIKLLSHGIAVLYFNKQKLELPEEISGRKFIVSEGNKVFLPSGLEPDDSYGTIQEDFVMVRNILLEKLDEQKDDKYITYNLKIQIPDRMKNTKGILVLKGAPEEELDKISINAYHDRYAKSGDGHAFAIERVYAKRNPGFGGKKNLGSKYVKPQMQYRTFNIPNGGECFLQIVVENCAAYEKISTEFFITGHRDKSRSGKEFKLPEIMQDIPQKYYTGVPEFEHISLK